MKFTRCLILFLTLASNTASALTLQEAIDRAQTNYPTQAAAREAVREARLQLQGVIWGLTPSALASYTKASSQITTIPELPAGTIPPGQTASTEGFGISISNFWNAPFRAKLAKSNINLQEELAEVSGNALALTVVQAYAAFVGANQQLSDCREFKSSISGLAETADNPTVSAGAQAILTQLGSVETAIEAQRLKAADTLMELISKDTSHLAEISTEIPVELRDMPAKLDAVATALVLLPADQALSRALKNAPELKAAGYNRELAERARKAQWIQTVLPDMNVSWTNNNVGTSVYGIPFKEHASTWTISATWTFGAKNVVDGKISSSKVKQAELKQDETERTIITSVKNAYIDAASLAADVQKQSEGFVAVVAQFNVSKEQFTLMRGIATRLEQAQQADLAEIAHSLKPLQNAVDLAKFQAAVASRPGLDDLKPELAKLKPVGDLAQLNTLIGTGLQNWGKLYEEILGYIATAAQIHMYTGDLIRLDQAQSQR